MRASLPMYDYPELRAATDAWWQAIARALRRVGVAEASPVLTREGPREALWRAPDLLLTQTCGYPLRHAFAGVLRAVAAPVYRAPGCDAHRYASAIVAREEDGTVEIEAFRGRVVACNAPDSQSGCNAMRALVAPLADGGRFFAGVRWTGAHRGSLAALRAGDADLAAIDAVSHALVAAHAPHEIEGLTIIGWSPRVPALPYVVAACASDERVQEVRAALGEAVADPACARAREALLIEGFALVDDAAYEPVVEMREHADATGYVELTPRARERVTPS